MADALKLVLLGGAVVALALWALGRDVGLW